MSCGKPDHTGKKDHFGCICEAVRVIARVQDIGSDDDCIECSNDCFAAPLGRVSPARNPINTRAFMLLTKDGKPFKGIFKKEGGGCGYSVFFRVQSIFDGCCATLQILEPTYTPGTVCNLDTHCYPSLCDVTGFNATGTCITVDLNCFCGIQCVLDTFVDLCPNN